MIEKRYCENDSPYDAQLWYPSIFADLIKSLKYYDLAKTRIKICQGFMRSYTAKTKEELEETINLLLNGIKRNELLYTQAEYDSSIGLYVGYIQKDMEQEIYNLDTGGCTIL